jgi:hypothetical protein
LLWGVLRSTSKKKTAILWSLEVVGRGLGTLGRKSYACTLKIMEREKQVLAPT